MNDLRKAAEMTQPEALRLADMLENNYPLEPEAEEAAAGLRRLHEENEHLRQALLQPEWVGLTDEEAREISFNLPIKWTGHLQGAASIYDFARAIEAKLKEKNNG